MLYNHLRTPTFTGNNEWIWRFLGNEKLHIIFTTGSWAGVSFKPADVC
uniref:Uncharacterized protein n=1 Tax=Nelumbo nucifera TaxID=4432 RepID=A0A822Z8C5_NELNU|nr:TPA_asm: hypothetical protein HUJ06_008389 [Nelumbo nucifera]